LIVTNLEKEFFRQKARKESFMRNLLFMIFLTLTLLLAIVGCSEEQRQRVDKLTSAVESVTQSGQAFMESPAGQIVPIEIRSIVEICGAVAMGLVVAWRDYRRKQAQTALEEIVTGVEIAKQKSDDVSDAIKDAQNITQSAKTTELVAQARAA
jgi:hypothetical protein